MRTTRSSSSSAFDRAAADSVLKIPRLLFVRCSAAGSNGAPDVTVTNAVLVLNSFHKTALDLTLFIFLSIFSQFLLGFFSPFSGRLSFLLSPWDGLFSRSSVATVRRRVGQRARRSCATARTTWAGASAMCSKPRGMRSLPRRRARVATDLFARSRARCTQRRGSHDR